MRAYSDNVFKSIVWFIYKPRACMYLTVSWFPMPFPVCAFTLFAVSKCLAKLESLTHTETLSSSGNVQDDTSFITSSNGGNLLLVASFSYLRNRK